MWGVKWSESCLIKLSSLQQEIMDQKVFEPYFVQYRNKQEYLQRSINVSINEVIKRFTESNKKQSKLFFKVNLQENVHF